MTAREASIGIRTSVLVLAGIGLVWVWSASSVLTRGVVRADLVVRHGCWLLLAVGAAVAVARTDHRTILRFGRPLGVLALVLLGLVLVPGIGGEVNRVHRWFRLGYFSFQPSEFAKLALVIYLADFLARRGGRARSFREGFVPPVLVVMLAAGLIFRQPDLGTAALVVAVAFAMMLAGGVRPAHAFGFLLVGGLLAAAIGFESYHVARIRSFLDPSVDPLGAGYQVRQSVRGFELGGWTGVGVGAGNLKLAYLYAAYSDFILPVIAEEAGAIGTGLVMLCYLVLMVCTLGLRRRAPDKGGELLVFGIAVWIGLQVAINVGTVTKMIPPKGIPLPFVSYGGSSLLVLGAAVGLLLSVARAAREEVPVPAPEPDPSLSLVA